MESFRYQNASSGCFLLLFVNELNIIIQEAAYIPKTMNRNLDYWNMMILTLLFVDSGVDPAVDNLQVNLGSGVWTGKDNEWSTASIREISHVLWAALGSWSFFVFIAFTMFLPIMVLMPQKFAICFTLGCIFIIESFFALKGPKNQLAHMSSKERLPFTLGFIATMVGTGYMSKVLRSYLFKFAAAAALVIAVSSGAPSTASKGNVGLVLQESL
ncbi:hypothetical protein MKW92_053098 [Papaver armeniacum]|nr:hypothetical protein MKW92_053098 [Papaver armeniacum]